MQTSANIVCETRFKNIENCVCQIKLNSAFNEHSNVSFMAKNKQIYPVDKLDL